METLREDFVLDNKPGDYITIMLQNGTEWTGTLLDWNERRVRIEVNGAPRSVSFSIISAYYPAAPVRTEAETKTAPAPKPLTMAQQAADRVTEAHYCTAYDPDLVRERLRLAPNTIEKERATALFHSFQRIWEQADGDPDPLEIRRIMAAADKLSLQYPDSPLTQNVIGEMALKIENWDLAEESLYAAGCYAQAFFAAEKLNNAEKLAEDGACHLLYEKKKEADVVYTFIRLAASAGDLSVFRRFLQLEGDRYPQISSDCLCWLLREAAIPLPDGDGVTEPTVIDAMSELFDRSYPDPDNAQITVLEHGDDDEEDTAATPSVQAITSPKISTGLTGYIYDYSSFRKIGRIHGETKSDWFFHFNHISDASLQGMISLEPGRRYLVTFDVGHNNSGECAVNIRLTDPQKPWVETPDPYARLEGVISRFFPTYMNGQITSGSDVYNFRVDEITDMDLQAYCEVFSDAASRKMEVTFSLRQLRDGKLVAVNIKKREPFTEEEKKSIWEKADAERHRSGTIARYYPTQRRGIISDNGTDFFFDLRDIADPLLKAYCEYHRDVMERQFKVSFSTVRRAGRYCAENIWKVEPFSEEERSQLLALCPPWEKAELTKALSSSSEPGVTAEQLQQLVTEPETRP